MRYLKVILWGREIGRLVWNPSTRQTYFAYNAAIVDEIPDVSPLMSPANRRNLLLPIFGDERPIYQGLPPFIADSLPDAWGNTLFDKWVKDNRIPRNQITPLYKLMFIGTRGMGALEYEPAAEDIQHNHGVDLKRLYDLSLKILADRENAIVSADETLTLQTLLAVGTSAGGRQMKAIVAINEATGEIRSGQANGLDGFEYYIVKFGDSAMPVAEIETAYYQMATAAGIEMQQSRQMAIGGINHFVTRRFDRRAGEKIHLQTLAAINPEANSYEDLLATSRELGLPQTEIEQLYRRMVFNVLANNTDDHNKNFSFLLAQGDRWHLAPAYDITFIFNVFGTGANKNHRFSVGGKICDITIADLLEFGRLNDIKNANKIIDDVAKAINNWPIYAENNNVPQPWRGIIQQTLTDNLTDFMPTRNQDAGEAFVDKYGRNVSNVAWKINAKGCYEFSAIIDGKRRRRVAKPLSPEYNLLIGTVANDTDTYQRLVETILPPL